MESVVLKLSENEMKWTETTDKSNAISASYRNDMKALEAFHSCKHAQLSVQRLADMCVTNDRQKTIFATGIGKSAIVARRFADSMSSISTPVLLCLSVRRCPAPVLCKIIGGIC